MRSVLVAPLLPLALACGESSRGAQLDASLGADASEAEDGDLDRTDAAESIDLGLDAGSIHVIDRESAITCTSTAIDLLIPPVCVGPELAVSLPSEVRTVIDLSGAGSGSPGTCGPYFEDASAELSAIQLPLDRDQYPLVIRLPRVEAADPSCAACSEFLSLPINPLRARFGELLPTAFGIAVETRGEIGSVQQPTGDAAPKVIAVSVPPPWYLVSGGCGEACAYPCLGGYQEFGIHSCSNIPYGAFGFATWDAQAPAVEAIVDLLDPPNRDGQGPFGRQCFFVE